MIANNMKRNYVVWNQKSVTDEIIVNDLYRLSQGKLKLPLDTRLMNVNVQPANTMMQKNRNNNNNFKRNNNNNNQMRKNNNNNNNRKNKRM